MKLFLYISLLILFDSLFNKLTFNKHFNSSLLLLKWQIRKPFVYFYLSNLFWFSLSPFLSFYLTTILRILLFKIHHICLSNYLSLIRLILCLSFIPLIVFQSRNNVIFCLSVYLSDYFILFIFVTRALITEWAQLLKWVLVSENCDTISSKKDHSLSRHLFLSFFVERCLYWPKNR